MSLSLSDLWVDDDGIYVCDAHNHFGTVQAEARITVTGLGKPNLNILNCYHNCDF